MQPTRQDIDNIALSTEANKTFCLLKVKGVNVRGYGARKYYRGIKWYEIRFENNISIAAVYLHAFVCVRNGERQNLSPSELCKGDLIWVDVGQFLGDGSFTMRKPTATPSQATKK